jgi:hypothetical protein
MGGFTVRVPGAFEVSSGEAAEVAAELATLT